MNSLTLNHNDTLTCVLCVLCIIDWKCFKASLILPGAPSWSYLISKPPHIIFTLFYFHNLQTLHWKKTSDVGWRNGFSLECCMVIRYAWKKKSVVTCKLHHLLSTLFSSIASLLVSSVFSSVMWKALWKTNQETWSWITSKSTLCVGQWKILILDECVRKMWMRWGWESLDEGVTC